MRDIHARDIQKRLSIKSMEFCGEGRILKSAREIYNLIFRWASCSINIQFHVQFRACGKRYIAALVRPVQHIVPTDYISHRWKYKTDTDISDGVHWNRGICVLIKRQFLFQTKRALSLSLSLSLFVCVNLILFIFRFISRSSQSSHRFCFFFFFIPLFVRWMSHSRVISLAKWNSRFPLIKTSFAADGNATRGENIGISNC